MISPLRIGLQGLAPGSSPIEIATQGFIIQITAPEAESDGTWIPLRSYGPPDATPYDSRKKKKGKKQVDCIVNVQGVRGTLTATGANLRRLAVESELEPIFANYFLRFWEWQSQTAAKAEPETAAVRAATAARIRGERQAERQADAELAIKAKHFRDAVAEFKSALRPTDDPDDLIAMIVGLSAEISNLKNEISTLRAPNPKRVAKTSR